MKLFNSPKRMIKYSVLLISILPCLLISFVFMYANDIGPFAMDLNRIPIYPNARDVQVHTTMNVIEGNHSDFPYDRPYKTVTFVTYDYPGQVYAFYKDVLSHRPFEDWRTNNTEEMPGSLRIFGYGHRDISPPMYVFEVATEEKGLLTHVTVERWIVPGM